MTLIVALVLRTLDFDKPHLILSLWVPAKRLNQVPK
jgi:hypothetical protein